MPTIVRTQQTLRASSKQLPAQCIWIEMREAEEGADEHIGSDR